MDLTVSLTTSGIDATEAGTLCVDDTVDSNAYHLAYDELLATIQEIKWGWVV
jgi:hypothetical protein